MIKKLSEVTYRIQQAQGKRVRKIVHFDHLKPCASDVNVTEFNRANSQAAQQSTSATANASSPQLTDKKASEATATYGTNLWLIDDDDEDVEQTIVHAPVPVTEPPPVNRYPTGHHRPP